MLKKIVNLISFALTSHRHLKSNSTQPDPLEWLKTIDIDSVIDIGANEGQFLEKALELYPDKQIFCFEPLLVSAKILNDKFGQIDNVKIIENAIGDKNEERSINHCRFSPSSSILEMENLHKEAFPYTDDSSPEKIIIKRLDDIFEIKKSCKKPFIKVDTQGYELYVINGGIEIFKRAPIVMIEVSYKVLYRDQPLFDEVYRKLIEIGFIYMGNVDQLLDPRTNQPLQADAIFLNKKYYVS